MTGKLVVVEGIDGSGKSTLVRALLGVVDALVTREPTNGPHGTALREAFAAGIRLPAAEERRLFECDRREHLAAVVEPALASGRCVVIDRSYYSTAAYQGRDGEDARAIVLANEQFAPRPDVLVYLDLPPAFALARIQARAAAPTAPETYDNLRACSQRYEAMWADPELLRGVTFLRLDAREPPEHLVDAVRQCIRAHDRPDKTVRPPRHATATRVATPATEASA